MDKVSEEEKWTEIITPQHHWWDIRLGEIWQYRDLIYIFIKRDIVAVYKQTLLGPLWFFLSPIFTVLTFTLVFNKIAHIPTDEIPAPLFYMAGITFWNYFSGAFQSTSGTFIQNASIFGKVYFPRMTVPISVVLSNLIKFFIQFTLFLLVLCYYIFFTDYQVKVTIYVLLFPLLLVIMALMALSLGIIISALTTKYRDFTFFIAFGVTLLMYASPVIYPLSAIPDLYKPFLEINPVVPLMELFRLGFLGTGTLSWPALIYSGVVSLVLLVVGLILFNRTEKTFMDTV